MNAKQVSTRLFSGIIVWISIVIVLILIAGLNVGQGGLLAEILSHGWGMVLLVGVCNLLAISLVVFSFLYRQRLLLQSISRAEQEKQVSIAVLMENANRIAKLNRIYAMLKAVNHAIVRKRDPQALFVEACRLTVDEGGFRMAWVGTLDAEARQVLPVAHFGIALDYLEKLQITVDDSPKGLGPTALAFRSGEVRVVNDIEQDQRMLPWRDDAKRLGYRASASFPLIVEGRVVATLNLYSAEPNCFDPYEVQLLTEMVEDMAFALDFIEKEKQRLVAEEELQKFFQVIEQSPASIIITDTKGCIEYVNPKFLSVTGFAVEEVLGENPHLLKSGETPAKEYSALWQTIMAGGEWHGEFHNRKKDGALFWERAVISPIRNRAGEITNFLAVKEDVTQQKVLEEQLAKSQKMETVGRLAGGVAHDFNNMLGVILGSVELALEQVAVDSPLRVELEEIWKAATRSADLTRQLLAFARKQIALPQVLDLNNTLAAMLSLLRRLLGEDIDLFWQPGAGLWPVKNDPSQVDQILANLAVNARDAMDRNGELFIETANVTLDESFCQRNPDCRIGDHVMLSVCDTGVGMSQATLARIFEPFFTTKGLGSGTGLGLATIYGIVRQNNGCIIVDSKLGTGSSFRIYLPRAESAASIEQESLTEWHSVTSGGQTVLLVEDEASILDLADRFLSRSGYTVFTANRPSQALTFAASHSGPLHLLICDIILPEMDGKQMADKLAVLHPESKIIFMSGYTADVLARHGVGENDVNFLMKPFSMQDLLAKVRQVLNV